MSPQETRDRYFRLMKGATEEVRFSRPNFAGSFGPVLARIMGFQPDDVVMDVQQGDRKMVVFTADLEASGFPLPLRKNDRIAWNGKVLPVKSVDDATRRVQGVLIAYELVVSGA